MSGVYYSFEDFQKTKVWVSDINQLMDTGIDGVLPGFIYMRGSYFIEDHTTETGFYHLPLCNMDHSDNKLETLEKILYEYAADENSWVEYHNVEFRIRMKVPKNFDEKRLDGMLMYLEECMDEDNPSETNPPKLLEGESSWVYYKDC